MTERSVQDALYGHIYKSGTMICPCYTPAHWWECDLFAVTAAGYATEYEIKLTLADYRADANKFWHSKGKTKHELLSTAAEHTPTKFYFVVPDGMVSAADVPAWAGLKYIQMRKRYAPGDWHTAVAIGPSIRHVKDAPTLHRRKVDATVMAHMRHVFYGRYWAIRRQNPGIDDFGKLVESE